MNHVISPQTNKLYRLTRLHSLVVNGAFLALLFLILTNEDKPQGPAQWVVLLMACAIGCNFAAWRWQKEGGIALFVTGLALITAAFYSSLFFMGFNLLTLLVALLTGLPFLMAGFLFWRSGQNEIAQG